MAHCVQRSNRKCGLILTDITGSTTSTGSQSASITVGPVTGTSVPLLSIGLTQPGSGGGVSDLITALAFASGTPLSGALPCSFQSATDTGRPPPAADSTSLRPEPRPPPSGVQ